MSVFLKNPLKFHVPSRKELSRNPLARLVAAEIEVASSSLGETGSGDDDNDEPHFDEDSSSCGCDDCRAAAGRSRYRDPAWRNEALMMFRRWGISVVSDGSLPSGGFEIPLAPAGGDLWLDEVSEVCAELRRVGASVSRSCGLHIHCDARDFKWADIRRLMRLYAHVEPALFHMVPLSRATGSYSVPCASEYKRIADGKPKEARVNTLDSLYGYSLKENQTADSQTWLNRNGYTKANGYRPSDIADCLNRRHRGLAARLASVKQNKYASARYNACNLHSWVYRGTVELRLPSGTVLPERIQNWGLLWASVVEFALVAPDNRVRHLVETTTPKEALHIMCASQSRLTTFINERSREYSRGAY